MHGDKHAITQPSTSSDHHWRTSSAESPQRQRYAYPLLSRSSNCLQYTTSDQASKPRIYHSSANHHHLCIKEQSFELLHCKSLESFAHSKKSPIIRIHRSPISQLHGHLGDEMQVAAGTGTCCSVPRIHLLQAEDESLPPSSTSTFSTNKTREQ